MKFNSISRSPFTPVLGFFLVLLAVLFCWLAPLSSAHAHGVRPHSAHAFHHARPSYYPPRPASQPEPDSQLSPEQQAVLDWIMTTAHSTLSLDQARTVVVRSYEQANRLAIDPLAFLAIMRLESGFNPHAVSNHGARGLMQVMPRVHKEKLHGRSAYDIETSIEVGAQILGDCVDKFPGELNRALNCYSGGGGKAYNKLFAHFHHQADHATIYALFREPDVLSYRPGTDPSPPPLPADEAVYQIAMK